MAAVLTVLGYSIGHANNLIRLQLDKTHLPRHLVDAPGLRKLSL